MMDICDPSEEEPAAAPGSLAAGSAQPAPAAAPLVAPAPVVPPSPAPAAAPTAGPAPTPTAAAAAASLFAPVVRSPAPPAPNPAPTAPPVAAPLFQFGAPAPHVLAVGPSAPNFNFGAEGPSAPVFGSGNAGPLAPACAPARPAPRPRLGAAGARRLLGAGAKAAANRAAIRREAGDLSRSAPSAQGSSPLALPAGSGEGQSAGGSDDSYERQIQKAIGDGSFLQELLDLIDGSELPSMDPAILAAAAAPADSAPTLAAPAADDPFDEIFEWIMNGEGGPEQPSPMPTVTAAATSTAATATTAPQFDPFEFVDWGSP